MSNRVMMPLLALCLACSAATGVTFLLAILYANAVLLGICAVSTLATVGTLFLMVRLDNR